MEVPIKRLEKKNTSDELVTTPGNNTTRSILDIVDLTKSSFTETKKNEADDIKMEAVWKFSKENLYRQSENKKEIT